MECYRGYLEARQSKLSWVGFKLFVLLRLKVSCVLLICHCGAFWYTVFDIQTSTECFKIFFLQFLFVYLKGRERPEILVYWVDVSCSCGWAWQQPGAWNLIHVSYVDDRDPKFICCLPWYAQTGSWNGEWHEAWNSSTGIWNAGMPRGIFF